MLLLRTTIFLGLGSKPCFLIFLSPMSLIIAFQFAFMTIQQETLSSKHSLVAHHIPGGQWHWPLYIVNCYHSRKRREIGIFRNQRASCGWMHNSSHFWQHEGGLRNMPAP